VRLSTSVRVLAPWFLALVLVFLATCRVASADVVLRGLDDPRAFTPGSTSGAVAMHELGHLLRASVVRADVRWEDAEPQRGVFDETYLSQVSATIDTARAEGMAVIITSCKVPKWASDSTFWNNPPAGFTRGRYYPFYPVRTDRLDDYRLFAEYLARRFAGRVMAYECWNEPNLWPFIYPQRTATDGLFAAHRYIEMIRAFSAGVRSGDPAAQVVVGATAPTGRNDRLSTSPQRFASVIKHAGVEDLFDAYSHHPYMTGGATNVAPERPPRDPSSGVSLGNISTLLKVFPNKPFYLTEYGYNTSFNLAFGFSVSLAQQADYLRRAYSFAGRYPQIKMLVWYMLRDRSPSGRAGDIHGIYLGLRHLSGAKKPAWYSFARGNRLTLAGATTVGADSSLLLRGRLTCASVGGVGGKVLVVKCYRPTTGWRTIAKVTTGAKGYYRLRVWPSRSESFRTVWPGVVHSPIHRVLVR